jgi:hypothetical protein
MSQIRAILTCPYCLREALVLPNSELRQPKEALIFGQDEPGSTVKDTKGHRPPDTWNKRSPIEECSAVEQLRPQEVSRERGRQNKTFKSSHA